MTTIDPEKLKKDLQKVVEHNNRLLVAKWLEKNTINPALSFEYPEGCDVEEWTDGALIDFARKLFESGVIKIEKDMRHRRGRLSIKCFKGENK